MSMRVLSIDCSDFFLAYGWLLFLVYKGYVLTKWAASFLCKNLVWIVSLSQIVKIWVWIFSLSQNVKLGCGFVVISFFFFYNEPGNVGTTVKITCS